MNRGLVILGFGLILLGIAGIMLAALELALAWQQQPPSGVASAPFPRMRPAARVAPELAPTEGTGFTLIEDDPLSHDDAGVPAHASAFNPIGLEPAPGPLEDLVVVDDALHYEDPWAEDWPAIIEELSGAPVLAWDPAGFDVAPALSEPAIPFALAAPEEEPNVWAAALAEIVPDETSGRELRSRDLGVPRSRLVFTDVVEPVR
jgi:hypothetical protein